MGKSEVIKLMLGSGFISGITVSILNFLLNKRLKYREAQLRILDRIVDKQIIAYDNILDLVSLTRYVSIYPEELDLNIKFDKLDYPLKFIGVLNNKNTYNEYWATFMKITQDNLRWLDIKLVRELYFMQDYLVNLNNVIEGLELDDNKLRKVGVVVKQDFIDIAAEIEQLCFKFYNNEVTKMKLKNKDKWHKHPREVTEAKFQATNLYKYNKEIYIIGESS